ncbi:MAG: hypothetical protein ACR2FG_07675 [Marmoricola sp.]
MADLMPAQFEMLLRMANAEEGMLFGTIAQSRFATLVRRLAVGARIQEHCYAAVWEGYASIRPELASRTLATIGGRRFRLYESSISDVTTLSENFPGQSPNYLWPNGREWCLVTPIELRDSFLGCMRSVATAVGAVGQIDPVDPEAGLLRAP